MKYMGHCPGGRYLPEISAPPGDHRGDTTESSLGKEPGFLVTSLSSQTGVGKERRKGGKKVIKLCVLKLRRRKVNSFQMLQGG